jgi:hypothetical protein
MLLINGLTTNAAFKSKNFEKLSEEADNVYLTQEELQSMWELDLSNDERKERARDLFLIGAFHWAKGFRFQQPKKREY